jgi:glutamate dehydrogenase/leucine dehydrogenase
VLFDELGPGGDYERLIAFQSSAGLRGVLVVHSTALGPAFGGIRRMAYPHEGALVQDACALARSMSLKCALAGLDAGGAKAVVWDQAGLDLPAAYRSIGDLVEDLGGKWVCGPDIGTGDRELGWVRERTRWVNPEGNDAAGMTARGVIAGLRGLMRFLGRDGFAGSSMMVQGLGAVGVEVASVLLAEGAKVWGTDVEPDRAQRARESGVRIVAPEDWMKHRVDVFVPCAVGGVIDESVARVLPASAVCGSANNPIASTAAKRVLHERGVWVVPDFLVNAGAVAEGALTTLEGTNGPLREKARAKAKALVDGFEATTLEVLDACRTQGSLPYEVAQVKAEARLAAASPRT